MSSPPSDPPLLPPIDAEPEEASVTVVQDTTHVEREIHRRENRMKYKNKNDRVSATKAIFLKDEVFYNYGYDIIHPLNALEGTIVAVPNIQKELFDHETCWETKASLTSLFNVKYL